MSSIHLTLFFPRRRAAARLVAAVALMLGCAGLSAQSNTVDVCDRTAQVRAAILAAIPGGRCEALSSSDLAGITNLNLANRNSASSGILSLRADDFAELTGLRELDLRNNSLDALPANVFSGLDRLLALRLGGNGLTALPAGVFSGLDQLQILNLSANRLTALPAGIFEGLLRLWWLALSDNGLETLPEDVFSGLFALQYLDLSGNPGSDFGLTVRPRIEFVRSPDGLTSVVARLVLREGAPRPITAALEVTGATLSADSLTIPVGRTESDDVVTIIRPLGSNEPLELTLGQLTLGKAAPDSQYRGFVVSAGEAVIDICDRTDEVRAAILAAIPAGRCEALSPSDLAGITGLDLTNRDSVSSGISSLRANDFAGLTGLQTLNLSNNGLDVLPAGVFAGLAGLTGVDLSDNPGATFTLTVRPSLVPSPSPGSFSMKLALREGAPRTVTVRFTATGVTLADDAAAVLTIPTGGAESRAVTLNLAPGSTSFELTFELFALGGEDDDYPGVAVATEAASLGFVNVCDRTAQVRAAILDATSTAGDACETVSVSELAAITELDLEDAGIRSLQADDFERLTGLQVLRLDENGLDELHKDVFSGLINLQTLYLHENRLETLPLSVFSGLTSLRTLFLQSNRLRTLPEGIFSELVNLETLRLDINKRPTALMLPERIFSGLTNLRRLDLNDNGLSALPANIFSGLENLGLLRLYNNDLETLPAGIFSELSSRLHTLNLRDNRLETLPEGVFDGLTGLQDLNLNDNELTTLPEGIFDDLVNLRSLALEHNNLETLPDGVFSELTNLEGLYLTANNLETLPADVFSGLTNLENLFLHLNRWKTLPEGIFLGLTNLQAVWLNVVGRELFTFEPKLEIEPFPLNGDKTTVRLTLRGGAPRSVTVEVSPVGVTLSTNFLTIPTGSTESAAVTVTLIPGSTSVSLTVTSVTLGGSAFGYFGFGATVEPVRYTVAGICDRTPQVQSGILAATAADDACYNASPDDLAEILELDLSSTGIESLQGDDFAGLTRLTKLDLTDNQLHELPAGVFSGLTNLTEVRLGSNPGTTFTLTIEAALDVSPLSDGAGVSLKLVSREGVPRLVTAVISTTAGITLSTNFWTIPTGGVESNLVEVTRSPDATSTRLTWEIFTLGGSDDQYPGIRIVAGGRIADTITDICARTDQVQGELLFQTPSDDVCETVLVSELAAITTLQLSYSGITGLQAGDFAHLAGLQTLYLQGNRLNTLPDGVFSGLTGLQTLSLHDNELNALPEGVFSGLTSLQILRLDVNRLNTLPEDIFSELAGLQRLDLDNNRLETLPEDVFSGLARLQRLYLFANNLAVLPAGVFSGLGQLRTLWLSHNRLSALPPNVFSGLYEIRSLWLFANPGANFTLTVRPEFTPSPLPDDFTSATVKLVLREGAPRPIDVTLSTTAGAMLSTDFVTIPPGAVESDPVTITRSLDAAPFDLTLMIGETDGGGFSTRGIRIVAGAPVEELTLNVCARTVQVRDEILAATPADDTCGRVLVLELAAIAGLDLAGTRITSLRRGDFAGLTGLQTLNLANNELTTLPRHVFSMATAPQVLRDMFSSLVNLRNLDLSSNGITFLPDDVFSGLSGLQTLDLSDNLLSSLSSDNLNLPALRVLDLSANPLISSPRTNIFTHLSSLEELYLSGISSFTTGLPAGIFSGLSRLRGLHLPVNDEGAPLTSLRFEFVRTDDEEAGSLSAEVELRVPEGAPFPVQADFDLERLTGPSQVMMETGSTRADAFVVTLTSQVLDGFVTATPPAAPMTADCQRPSASAPHACYQGVGFPPAARFTLGKATDLPEVTITGESSMVSVREGGTATVTVRAHRPLSEALTVAYTIGAAAGDGRAGADQEDYTDVGARMVTIAAGETAAAILIGIDDDSDVEPTREGFRVSLSADESYVLGPSEQTTAIVVINEGVCDRATADVILEASNPQDCADVTDGVLAEITGLGYLLSPHGRTVIFREGDFAGLDALENLFLESTTPTFTSANVFSGLDTLLNLYLNGANVRALPAGIFSGLSALRELHFEGANLGSLPAGIFSGVRDTLRVLNMRGVTLEEPLPAGIFVGLSLDVLRLPPSAALSLRFNVVEENALSNPTSARVSVVLAQGAPFALSVDLSAVNAALSTDSLVIPAGGAQSAVFEVRRGSGEEVPVVRFAGDPMTVREGVTADLRWDVLDRYVMGVFRPTDVTITSTAAAGNTYAAGETITAEVTFGDDVDVSTATDGPRLALGIGDQIRFAGLAGTRTDTLIFGYEVTRDDYDADGISIGGSALALGVGSAGITDSFGNSVRLELGAHAVKDAAAHKVAGRRLSLSFDPPSVTLKAGETVQVRVILRNAGALLQDVSVHLSPGGGLGADRDVVTFIPGGDVPGDDVVTITVGATVTAMVGESSVSASVTQGEQDKIMALVADAEPLSVRIDPRVITVSFEPNPVTLARGGSTKDVIISASPRLESGERFTVAFSGLPGVTVGGDRTLGAGDASQRRLSLSADASAVAGSLIATTVEGAGTFLGVPEVRFDELRVEVVPLVSVEFIPETIEIVQGRSTMLTVTTSPVLEAGQSATVELTVPADSGLTLERTGGGASGVSLTLALTGPALTEHEVVILSSAAATVGASELTLTVSDGSGVELTTRSLPVDVVWPQAAVTLEPAAGVGGLVLARGSDATVRLTLTAEPGLQSGLLPGQEAVLEVSVEDNGLSVTPDRVTLTADELSTEVTVSAAAEAAGVVSTLTVTAVSGVRLDATTLPVRVEREFALSFEPKAVALTAGGLPVPTTLVLTEEAGSLEPGEEIVVTLTPSIGINVASASGEPVTTVTLRKDVADATTRIWVSAESDAAPSGSLMVSASADNARVGGVALRVSVMQPGGASVEFIPERVEVVQGHEAAFTVTTNPPLEAGQSATVELAAPVDSGLTLEQAGGASGGSLTLRLAGPALTRHEIVISSSADAPVGSSALSLTVSDSRGVELTPRSLPVDVVWPRATVALEPSVGVGELVLARGSDATVRVTLNAEPGLLSGQEAVLEVSVEGIGLSVEPDRVTLTGDNVSTEVTISATSAGARGVLRVAAVSGVRLDATTLPVRVEREFTLSFEPDAVELTAGGLSVPTTLVLTEEAGSLAPGEEVEVTLTPSMGVSVTSASGEPVTTVTLRKDVADATTRIRVSANLDADYRVPGFLTASVSGELDNARIGEANLSVSVRQRKISMFFEPPEIRQVRGGAAPAMTLPARVRLKVSPALQSTERLVVDFASVSGWAFQLYEYTFTSITESVEVFVIADMNTSSGEIRPSVSVEEGDLTVEFTPLTVEVVRGVRLSLSAPGDLDVATIIAGQSADVTLKTEPALEGDERVTVTLSVGDGLAIGGDELVLSAANRSATVRVSALVAGLDLSGGLSASGSGEGVEVLDGASLRVVTRDAVEVSVVVSPSSLEVEQGRGATFRVTTEPELAAGQAATLTLTIDPNDAGLSFAGGSFGTTVELVGGEGQSGWVDVAVSAALNAAFGNTARITSSLAAKVGVEVNAGARSQVGLTVVAPRVSASLTPADELVLSAGSEGTVAVTVDAGRGLQGDQEAVLEASVEGSGLSVAPRRVTLTATEPSAMVKISAQDAGVRGTLTVTAVSGVRLDATTLPIRVEREFALSFEPETVELIAGGLPVPTTLVLTEEAGSLEPGEEIVVTLTPSMGVNVTSESGEPVTTVTLRKDAADATARATTRIGVSAELDAALSGSLTASASADNARVGGATLRVTVELVEVAVLFEPPDVEIVQGHRATFTVTTNPALEAGQSATVVLTAPMSSGVGSGLTLGQTGGASGGSLTLFLAGPASTRHEVVVSASADAAVGDSTLSLTVSDNRGVELTAQSLPVRVVWPQARVALEPAADARELVLARGSDTTVRVTLNAEPGLQSGLLPGQEAVLEVSVEGSGLSVAPRRVTLTATELSAEVTVSAASEAAGAMGALTVTVVSGVRLSATPTLPVRVEREFALSFDPETVALTAGGLSVPATLVLTEEAGSLEPGEEVEVTLTPSMGINVTSESGEPVTTVTLRKDVAAATARATMGATTGIRLSAGLNAETPATLRVSASAPNARVSGTALRVTVLPPELRVLFEPPDVEVVQGRRATFTVTTVPVLEAGQSVTVELTVVSDSAPDSALNSGLSLSSAEQPSSNVLTLPLIGPDSTSREAGISAAVTAEPGEFLVASKLIGISGIGAATMQPSLAVSVVLPRVEVEFEPSDELVMRKGSERAVTLTLSAASGLPPGRRAVFDVTLTAEDSGLSVTPERVTLTETMPSTTVKVSARTAGVMGVLRAAPASGVSLSEEAALPVRVEREFTLSFEPGRVELTAGGLPVPTTLRLAVAGSLAPDEAVEVTLTPSMGINVTSDAGEALSRVMLTSGAGAATRIRVGAGLNADYTIPGFLTASGSLLPNGVQVGETELAVTVLQREIAVLFEPSKLTLVSGGAATSPSSEKATLRAEPELQGGETVAVSLNASGGLAERGELAVSPTETITLSSMMNTVEVSVEAMTGPGVVEVSATVDTAVSSLGNARLSAQPLTVEVVRGVELRLAGHGGLDAATIIADGSTDVTVTTWPPLERDERVVVTLNASAGLTIEDAPFTVAILTGTVRSAAVRLSASVPGGPGGFVSASASGENVVVVGVEPSLPVETRSAAEVAVVLSPRELAVQQGGEAVLHVTTVPRLGLGQSVSLTLTIAPDNAGLSFADDSFSTMVRLIGGEGRSYMAELRVEALPDASIGGMAELSSTVTDVTEVAVSIGAQGRTTLTVTTPRVTVGFTPEGGVSGEGLSLDLDSSRKVTLNLTDFGLSGGQAARLRVSVEGDGLTLQGGVTGLDVSLDATDMMAEVTVSASGTAAATGWLVVRALEGVELSGEARLPIEVFQPVALRLVPPMVSVERGRSATFTVAITPALIADRAATVTLDIRSAGFTFDDGGRQRRVTLADDKTVETVEVFATAAIGSTAAVTVDFKAKGVSLTSPRPSLELRATAPRVTAAFDRAELVLAKGDVRNVEIRLTDYELTIPGQEIVLSVQGSIEGSIEGGLTLGAAMQPRIEIVLTEASPTTIVTVNAVAAGAGDLVVAAVSGAGLTEEARLEVRVLPGVAAQFAPAGGIELEQGGSTTFSVALTPPLQAGRLATVTLTAPAGLSFSDSSSLTLLFAGDETTRHEVVVRANADAPTGAAEIRSSLTGSTGGDPAPSQPSLAVHVLLAQVAVEFDVAGTVVLTVGTTMDVTVRLRADHGLQAGQEAALNLPVDGDGLSVAPERVTLTAAMPSTTVSVSAQTAGVEGFLRVTAASGVRLVEETTLPVLVRREFMLSFDPPSLVEAPAIGSTEEVTLKLTGSALNAGESLGVALQPSTSLSVSQSSVTLTLGDEDVLIGISLKEGAAGTQTLTAFATEFSAAGTMVSTVGTTMDVTVTELLNARVHPATLEVPAPMRGVRLRLRVFLEGALE